MVHFAATEGRLMWNGTSANCHHILITTDCRAEAL